MTDKSRYVIVFKKFIILRNLKNSLKLQLKQILIRFFTTLYFKKELCLEFLNGIFSFIIFDKKDKSIFCARDHVGVKPFYYFQDNNNFIVSSN